MNTIQRRFIITKCCACKYIILSYKLVLKKILRGLGFLLKHGIPQIALILNYLVFSSVVWIENADIFVFYKLSLT